MAKKRTILDLQKMKETGEQAVWMVIYDSCLAACAEEAGMDMILVGDSMGMIIYGWEGTVPVTMDMSIAHCQGVRRGAPNTYLIGDMPFGAYHASCEDAVNNAVRFIKEGGVDAIKLEGGVAVADKIEAISKAGIVVFGHVGLTPQSSAAMGGFKVQGKNTAAAKAVIDDAVAVYKAGARCLLLEGIPEETARPTRSASTRTSRRSSRRNTATSARSRPRAWRITSPRSNPAPSPPRSTSTNSPATRTSSRPSSPNTKRNSICNAGGRPCLNLQSGSNTWSRPPRCCAVSSAR